MTGPLSPSAPELLPVALRNTARTVVSLRSDHPPSIDLLRRSCDAEVAMLREELHQRGHPREVINDALYAQCALLDEAALRGLRDDDHDQWEREPLQLRVFGRNDAGEELVRRIAKRLHDPKPNLLLLGIFAAVLGLGFTGRLALNDAAERDRLTREIDERLTRAGGGARTETRAWGPVVVNPSQARRWRPSLMTGVAIACLAAALVWVAIDRWLLSSIATMAR